MSGVIRTIVLIVVTALASVFFIQNLSTAEVAFLTYAIAAPRALIYLVLFCAGALVGFLLHALRMRKRPAEPH